MVPVRRVHPKVARDYGSVFLASGGGAKTCTRRTRRVFWVFVGVSQRAKSTLGSSLQCIHFFSGYGVLEGISIGWSKFRTKVGFRNEFGMTRRAECTSEVRCGSIRFLIQFNSFRSHTHEKQFFLIPIPDPSATKRFRNEFGMTRRRSGRPRLDADQSDFLSDLTRFEVTHPKNSFPWFGSPVPDPQSLRYKEIPKQVRNDAQGGVHVRQPKNSELPLFCALCGLERV